MRTSSVFNILVKFAGIAVCGPAHAADAELPAWFAGGWCGKKDGATIEEHWLAPAGGSMLATSRTTAPARPLEFEFLRVQLVDGVPTYIAQPQGVPPTSFVRTAGGTDWMRFENPKHDFPTRVEYRRKGPSLHAEIAGPGPDGHERVIAFEYTRCGDAARAIHAFFDAFNRHDIDAIVALYADDAYLMSSDFDAPRRGHEGVRRTYSELFAQLPHVHDELLTLVLDGESAAAEFESSWAAGTNMPAGKLKLGTFFKVRDGRIVSDVTYFDAEPRAK